MSKMTDLWNDTISVSVDNGNVFVSFVEIRYGRDNLSSAMELDAYLTRKLIKKLKKALAEVEDQG